MTVEVVLVNSIKLAAAQIAGFTDDSVQFDCYTSCGTLRRYNVCFSQIKSVETAGATCRTLQTPEEIKDFLERHVS